MEFLQEVELSLRTLTVVMLLPFLPFALQGKYRYHPTKRKQGQFILQVVSGLVLGILLLKFLHQPAKNPQTIQLVLLHLAPPILTFLIVTHAMRAGSPRNSSASDESEATFRPVGKEVEKVLWDDIVISQDLKDEFHTIIEVLKDPKSAGRYGIDVPKGILLNGAPGTGKTTIAKALANTANLSFFALKMDEVVSKWVGESEKNLSKLFNVAQRYAPSVIFIDEIDSIGKARSGRGQQWSENLLNHLLQLIDGVVRTEGLYVIGATNRADLVDSALKRSGRLTKVVEIPLPDAPARQKLFEINLSRMHLNDDIDVDYLASITAGRSGADIKEICNQAGLNAFKRESGGGSKRQYIVTGDDMHAALLEFTTEVAAA